MLSGTFLACLRLSVRHDADQIGQLPAGAKHLAIIKGKECMISTSTKNIQKLAKQARRFLEIGDIHQAEMICDEAVALGATEPDMLLQIGKVHYFCKRYEEAGNVFQQELQLRPKDNEARIMLWATYRDGGNFEAMLDLAHQFQDQPLNANEVLFAYRSFLAACDWHSAEKMQEHVFALVKQRKIRHDLIPALLIELCGIPGLSPELVFDIHQQWGKEEVKEKRPYFPATMPAMPVAGRLKIAYISSDFKLHPVGFYMNQIIRSHDRQHFEVYCYAHMGRDDVMTQHIREHADHFIDITKLRDEAVAERIHADGIHILIDLSGHTTDTRLPVLAYRPAPVQMTYLGYPNTTGLPTVDYRITDHYAECEEGTYYMEKLLYMPQSFLCFGVDPSELREESSPAGQRDHITFASFNNVRKMNPQVIQTWSQILNRLPGSKLALKAKDLDNKVIRENMLREFASHGIQAERIEFRPYTKTYEEHIIQYNDTDVALDTFPYNGTTTTCDALVMGVPVITLVGESHAQRVSCSILKNIGLEQTITYSVDEYVDKAVAIANNRQGLTVLRNTLPTLFNHSILCQPEKFTRQLENLYHQAWQEKTAPPLVAEPNRAKAQFTQADQLEWVFITGMPRSGSTWCYNVVRKLYKHHSLGTMIGFIGENESVDSVLQAPTTDGACPRVIKFHLPTGKAMALLQSGRARAIYSQRDLRDVVVSLMDFTKSPFDLLLSPRLPKLIKTHQYWKQAPNVQRIEYQGILEQPQTYIRQISSWLGLSCTDQLIEEIALACSPETTQKHIKEMNRSIKTDSTAHIQQVSETRYFDTETLLNSNHIISGKIGRYKDRLSHEQIEKLNGHLKKWLIEEGYEPAPDEVSQINEKPCFEGELKAGHQDLIHTVTQADKPAAVSGTFDQNNKDKHMKASINPRTLIADIVHEELVANPIVIAEVGARIIDPDNNTEAGEIFHTLSVARVLAFEADPEACEQVNALNAHFAADISAYPYALSDKPGQQTLYITRNKLCSSLYKPNEKILERYDHLEDACLDTTCPIEVTSLDWFMEQENVSTIDFIKIDVQGAELDVFKGASKAMPQLLGLCTEVEFAELYQGQPLFGDIDAMLREYGLQFYGFREFGHRQIRGAAFHCEPQLLWADAIYFPSFELIDKMPAGQLLKLSVLSSLYEAYDLTQYALKRFDEISGTHYTDEFTQKLTALAQGKGIDNDNGSADKESKQIADPKETQQHNLQAGKGSKTVRIENDVLVVVPDDLNLMTPYVLEEQQDWFEDEIKFVRQLIKPGMQIIDIGANYGCYALTMAKLTGAEGRLWAFEPCSSTADHLQQSIDANGLDHIELIRAALSNRQGEATLSTQDNAELNSLSNDIGGTGSETVPLYRLDDCIRNYGWKDIDFLKLDAEGEEIRILEGGEKFFQTFSPLVMFELKHGDQINEGLIQAFRDMGYEPYKFIPGLMMLAPFDMQEEPDPFQLNLFCCKPDRARKLQESGLLTTGEGESELIFSREDALVEYLKPYPYAAPLLSHWIDSESELPGGEAYITALNAYATAQTLRGSLESYHWLQAAFIQMISALGEHANLPRLLTLARIATDLGRREAAMQALNQFVDVLNREQTFEPVEPFLAASEHAANIDPAGELANWCFGQALAERERLQAFSSYFTGADSKSVLNIIENLNYDDAEMGRRRELINRRYA